MQHWGQFLEDFALEQRGADLSAKTIENREDCLRTLAKISGKGPLEITKRDLLLALDRPHPRKGGPLAPGTKQTECSYFRSFFGWLKSEGHRDDDPSSLLKKVKVPRRKPRPFKMHQVDDILDSGIYKRTRDIVTIAALSGLRIGEIVKIRGEDIDLKGHTAFSVRKGSLEHTVPLHPDLLAIAEEYPRKGWWFPAPGRNKEFPEGGGHILMASASDRIGKAIRAAGISDTRLTGHSLRHFYATMLLRGGVNVRVVQEMLGHASLATTQLYMEVTDEEMVDAVDVLPSIGRRTKSARSRLAPVDHLPEVATDVERHGRIAA